MSQREKGGEMQENAENQKTKMLSRRNATKPSNESCNSAGGGETNGEYEGNEMSGAVSEEILAGRKRKETMRATEGETKVNMKVGVLVLEGGSGAQNPA